MIPAVPVPFRGDALAADAQQDYAAWMAGQQVAGVAVWAHTGRGPHLTSEQRHQVLAAWRAALPVKVIVAGAASVAMAREAKAGGADALLAFPRADDPVGHHAALSEVLPVIAFYLYEAAGGVAYDNPTLHAMLELPGVIGIKVATLEAFHTGDFAQFVRLSGICDRFAAATFTAPMEGYVRRLLWALAADGVIPEDACDDPWGPDLPPVERDVVRRAVREARGARVSRP